MRHAASARVTTQPTRAGEAREFLEASRQCAAVPVGAQRGASEGVARSLDTPPAARVVALAGPPLLAPEPAVALASAAVALGHVAGVRRARKRRTGVRAFVRRRPVGGLLAGLLLLTFLLLCVAPAIPILRLGFDASDALRRVSAIQGMLADGPSSLLNVSKLDDLQSQVDAIQRDLRELNGAANLVLAPISGFSARAETYRLLARMGTELATAGDEGLRIARLILAPLGGSVLSTDAAMPGITLATLTQARALLAEAEGHLRTALAVYQRIAPADMPSQLRPDTHDGHLLARLPDAMGAFGLLNIALDIAPGLLGVGQPAYFLVTAMDRSELRPIGGLMGNYGILALAGGKQMKQYPLALHNTYNLDSAYYALPALNSDPNPKDKPACLTSGPQPPAMFWWWPIRGFSCEYGWGLRDAGLAANFATNARMAMGIAEAAGAVPDDAPLQGMIAFTPEPIERILALTGPIQVPGFNTSVTATSLERQIHDYQLLGKTPPGQDRKEFTHQLSIALLARLRDMHGAALKPIVKVALDALRDKEIEVYLTDPRAEALLGQLGLSPSAAVSGDGFYVVDTNDGGNKANLYVTEQQTDVVTLLPDGGALHHLQIAVTYDKTGSVYEGTTGFEDYSDIQRAYLPKDAELLDYSGYTPPVFAPAACGQGGYASPITGCDRARALITPVTTSDVVGRSMVMGPVLVTCGGVSDFGAYDPTRELATCRTHAVAQTINIYLTWLTPAAFTLDGAGHGTYQELVEKQPGGDSALGVFVINDTHNARRATAALGAARLPAEGTARDVAFAALMAGAIPIYDAPLAADTTISYHV